MGKDECRAAAQLHARKTATIAALAEKLSAAQQSAASVRDLHALVSQLRTELEASKALAVGYAAQIQAVERELAAVRQAQAKKSVGISESM